MLNFADTDEVAAEVRRLRKGWTKTGNWSLEQICWHLNRAMRFSMRPGPHAAPLHDPKAAERLAYMLKTGRPPEGIQAPDMALPPAQVPDAAIDEFLATLTALKSFKGEFAPHRLFGVVSHDDFYYLHLLHSAHHLGHLIPDGE
jgi:uncharacterized protein DUF1569